MYCSTRCQEFWRLPKFSLVSMRLNNLSQCYLLYITTWVVYQRIGKPKFSQKEKPEERKLFQGCMQPVRINPDAYSMGFTNHRIVGACYVTVILRSFVDHIELDQSWLWTSPTQVRLLVHQFMVQIV